MFKYTRKKTSINGQKKTKTKHAKSPMASTSCPVRELTSPQDVQSASRPVCELAIRELAYLRVVQ